jgi:hypothetical protein
MLDIGLSANEYDKGEMIGNQRSAVWRSQPTRDDFDVGKSNQTLSIRASWEHGHQHSSSRICDHVIIPGLSQALTVGLSQVLFLALGRHHRVVITHGACDAMTVSSDYILRGQTSRLPRDCGLDERVL